MALFQKSPTATGVRGRLLRTRTLSRSLPSIHTVAPVSICLKGNYGLLRLWFNNDIVYHRVNLARSGNTVKSEGEDLDNQARLLLYLEVKTKSLHP